MTNRKQLYTPLTRLYVILTSIFGALTVLLFVVLCFNLKSQSILTVASALISIFGGLLASSVVAWIIDIATCARKNKNIVEQEKGIMELIENSLNDLFQSFADSFYDSDECISCETWQYWFDLLTKYDYHKNKSDFYDRMVCTYVSLNSIISEVNLLNDGLMKEFQTIKGGDAISELLLLSDSCKKIQNIIFENKNENTEHIKFMIRDVTLTLIRFTKFNEKKYCVSKQKEMNK